MLRVKECEERVESGEEYHLLHVDDWDDEAQEAVSRGRCIGTYDTIEEALAAYDAFADVDARGCVRPGAARLQWGEGHLVITDGNADHQLCFGPTLLSVAERRKAGLDLVIA